MSCDRDPMLIDALVDGELTPDETAEATRHIAGCAECSARMEARAALRVELGQLPRFRAPDVLRARVRAAVAGSTEQATPIVARPRWPWERVAAAAVIVALVGLGAGALVIRSRAAGVVDQVAASHMRSLIPGHLIDVASTDQHNVKPWFNGRVNLSPPVPNLDSAGFKLLGGRLDYIDGKTTAVVVYGRRLHVINVYVWPSAGDDLAWALVTRNGFHLIHWRQQGLEQWVASDLNLQELKDFSRRFRVSQSPPDSVLGAPR